MRCRQAGVTLILLPLVLFRTVDLTAAVPGNSDALREKAHKSTSLRLAMVNYQTIIGDIPSPLSKIHIGEEMSFQVFHRAIPGSGQIFPSDLDSPADMGIFVRTEGTLFAPNFAAHGETATSLMGPYTPWTPVSFSPLSGNGSSGNPYSYTVVADAGTTGLRLTMEATYVNSENFFRHNLTFTNTSGHEVCFDAFIGSDLYLASNDSGVPNFIPPHTPGGRDCVGGGYSILHIPLAPEADFHTARFYNDVWAEIGSGLPLTNTVAPGCQDNGAAVEWANRCIQPGGSLTILSATSFGEIPSVPAYTGRQLFEGIFFGRGPVASKLPEFWPQMPAQLPAQDSTREGLAADLQNAAVSLEQSGMHAQAQDAIELADLVLDPNTPFDLTAHGLTDVRVQAIETVIQNSDGSFFPRFERDIQSGNPERVAVALREGSQKLMDRVSVQQASGFLDVWYYFDIVVAIEALLVCVVAVPPCVLALSQAGGTLGFDNAALLIAFRLGPNGPTVIPTTSQSGLLILILMMAVAGAAFLYRRRLA